MSRWSLEVCKPNYDFQDRSWKLLSGTQDSEISNTDTSNENVNGRVQISRSRRRENMVGVNTVGVNIVVHDFICECC